MSPEDLFNMFFGGGGGGGFGPGFGGGGPGGFIEPTMAGSILTSDPFYSSLHIQLERLQDTNVYSRR